MRELAFFYTNLDTNKAARDVTESAPSNTFMQNVSKKHIFPITKQTHRQSRRITTALLYYGTKYRGGLKPPPQ